tara:strand:- start:373 stop:888 length:516 start_codon:yes stop_codon:yes gene_type:complete
MTINDIKHVIRSQKREIDMWDKYRHESKQTICIIGVLTLSVKLCKADGHFSSQEEDEILKIIPHESQQRHVLKRIIAEADKDINPIEHDAINLKSLLKDEYPEFLEFIIAVLYRLAHSDNIYSQSEDDDIREVAKIFGIKKDISERILEFFTNSFHKIKNLIINKKEKINA